jgi:hypothetical protein
MNNSPGPHWYIDSRPAASTEQMSLDLTRHLPRRLAISPVVVVTDRPAVLLSVVRKRWTAITREVARQFASTLDRQKKAGLQRELDHMRNCRFTVQPFTEHPTADCFFVSPEELCLGLAPCYSTLYLASRLSDVDLCIAVQNLSLNGLIVGYGDWLTGYEESLRAAFMGRIKDIRI